MKSENSPSVRAGYGHVMGLCAWALDETKAAEHPKSLNREHALGRQMGVLVDGPPSFATERMRFDHDRPERNNHREWTSRTPAAWVTNAFCTDCNGGWMARLDDHAKPLLKQLIAVPSSIDTISVGDASSLASWAFKVAIAFEYVAAVKPSSPEVRDRLFATKTAPSHAAVALGMASLTYANTLYAIRSADLALVGAPVRIFTLLLKHVLIQVAYSPEGTPTIDPRDLLPLRDRGRTLLYPPADPMTWPPAQIIDEEDTLRSVIVGTQPFPPELL